MDSVFGASVIVSLTAWHCVGVQRPAVCAWASGRQQECVSRVMNEAQWPVDELHCRAHLHGRAHLPLGKFKLLHEVHVPPSGLLGLNEEEGWCGATESCSFLWHSVCSAERITAKSSRRMSAQFVCGLFFFPLAATVKPFHVKSKYMLYSMTYCVPTLKFTCGSCVKLLSKPLNWIYEVSEIMPVILWPPKYCHHSMTQL